MKTEDFINRVTDFVSKDKFQKAIDELRIFLKNSKKIDEVIIHSARYNDIIRNIRMGTLSLDDAEISKNKIRYAVLDIIREIDGATENNQEYMEEAEKTLKEQFSSYSGTIGFVNIGGTVDIKSEGDISFGNIIK